MHQLQKRCQPLRTNNSPAKGRGPPLYFSRMYQIISHSMTQNFLHHALTL
jgi:hypothetical protein